jgi:hypothetical protein
MRKPINGDYCPYGVMSCTLVEIYRHIRGTCYLHLQDKRIVYQTVQHYIQEDGNLHSHCP